MKRLVLKLISLYQKYISPMKSKSTCRFTPTCSEYTKQAVEKYGTIKGIYKGLLRILRCNPFSKGGYDPLD